VCESFVSGSTTVWLGLALAAWVKWRGDDEVGGDECLLFPLLSHNPRRALAGGAYIYSFTTKRK